MIVYQENNLQDKITVITGAGDGLGKALALQCATYGATVVLLGRTLKKLDAVYDAIEDRGLPTPAIFPINLESATSMEYDNLKTVLETEFGRVDILINNAAILSKRSPIHSSRIDDWNSVLQVNATAPFLLSKTLLPLLGKSDGSRLLFTSDAAGRHGKAYWGAYAASKAALENLMQTLADELEDSNICVYSIDPGAVRTAMRINAFPAEDPSTVPCATEVAKKYLALLFKEYKELHGKSLAI